MTEVNDKEIKSQHPKKNHKLIFGISYNIILLGLVSLFTDVSSEMIVAVFPLFLLSIGGTPVTLGIINGITQATSNIVKGLSGWLSDKLHKRKVFIMTGYGISNLSKPLIGISSAWEPILGLKFLDRIGKGLRTSPRDSLIGYYADMGDKNKTGRAFGIHRSFDTTGAVIGPVLASIFIIVGIGFGNIILLSIIPGLIAMGILFFVKDVKTEEIYKKKSINDEKPISETDKLSKNFIIGLIILGIMEFASIDATFIILRAGEGMIDTRIIPVIYALLNIIYLGTSPLAGSLSDKIGRKKVIIIGLLLLLSVCILFIFNYGSSPSPFSVIIVIICFIVYGIYMGFVDPVSRALISDVAGKNKKGKAYGVYYFSVGILAIPESIIFGLIYNYNYSIAFIFESILLAILIVIFIQRDFNKMKS